MFNNFTIDNYGINWKEGIIFPIFSIYSYRHFQAACESSTWKGRLVHSLATLAEGIPLLGAIIALAELCLVSSCCPPPSPKLMRRTSPIDIDKDFQKKEQKSSDSAKVDAVADPAKKEMIPDPAKKEGMINKESEPERKPLKGLEDDVIIHEKPPVKPVKNPSEQEEVAILAGYIAKAFDEHVANKRVPEKLHTPDVKQEELELEVEDSDFPPDFPKQENSLAQGVSKASLNVNSLEQKGEPQTEKEATYQILTTGGFIADNDDIPDPRYGCKGEIQGNRAIRSLTARVTKRFPHALSPAALSEQKAANLEQYLIFSLKRFGHVFSLGNIIELLSGKKMFLKGFSEVFTIPMLASSFDEASKQSIVFNEKDREWISREFNQTTSSDSITAADIQEFVIRIQDPNFVGPISLGTGYDWHGTGTIFFGPFVIYITLGAGCGDEPGIHIFLIDPKLVTDAVIWQMAMRQEVIDRESFGKDRIEKELNGVRIHYEKRPMQETGNCTYMSMSETLHAFMVFRHLLNSFGEDAQKLQTSLDKDEWVKAFNMVRPEIEKFIDSDRQLVFKSLLDDIKLELGKTNEAKNDALRKIYWEVLNVWLKHYKMNGKHGTKVTHQMREQMQQLFDLLTRSRIDS